MKSFEEMSQPDNGHIPYLCALPAGGHPLCTNQFPGAGTPNPPPLSPVPETSTWVLLAVGLVAIALYRRFGHGRH